MFGINLPQPPAPGPESQGPVGAVEAMGFPSPARDYYNGGIDLNRLLIRDRTSTFLMRVSGNSMASAGIAHGDEVIVDRSLTPKDGSVVIAVQRAILSSAVWSFTKGPWCFAATNNRRPKPVPSLRKRASGAS